MQGGGVVVGDDEAGVERLPDAVSGVVAHHPVVEALGVGLNDAADDVDLAPRLDGLDAPLHRGAGTFDEQLRLAVDLTDGVGGVRVAVDPADVGGDVKIDEVSLVQAGRVRDAVADDLIDRGADRLGETHVAQARRVGAVVAQVLVGDPVELVGAHPRGDRLGGLGQGAGGQPPRDPDPLDRFGVLDLRGRDALGAVVEHVLGACDGRRHMTLRTERPGSQRATRRAVGQ